ncbi:glycosyltransferase [Christensenellaceae bacterium OttesenSCG-928-K19]|nr:glycosyltransferase [Christensenellaceae bacterium OttesenSCG-928-K19]
MKQLAKKQLQRILSEKQYTKLLERVSRYHLYYKPSVNGNYFARAPRLCGRGINLVGYIRSDFGLGQAVRMTATALEKSGCRFSAIDFEEGNPSPKTNTEWEHKITNRFIYRTNLFNVNGDYVPVLAHHLPLGARIGKYTVAIWYWELPDLPDEWLKSFDLLDEVWAPTEFVRQAIEKKATKPVLHMPVCITLEQPNGLGRGHYSLPDEPFLFLTMYDVFSAQARKNPQGAINAFLEAFGPEDTSVGLVLKINNSATAPEEIDILKKQLLHCKNIYMIDKNLSRLEVNGLLNCCDAVVSLHRSEGLGLLMAEGMFFGKPAIATNYSGNTDFMHSDNSCLVDYELVPVGQDYGVYEAKQMWAEADVSHAASYMKRLKEDNAYYNRIAQAGQQTILTEYSPQAVGRKMRTRLDAIDIICKNRNRMTH